MEECGTSSGKVNLDVMISDSGQLIDWETFQNFYLVTPIGVYFLSYIFIMLLILLFN